MSGFELLSEYLTHYFPILFFVVVALFFGVWSLVVSYLVQPKYPRQRSSRAMSVDRSRSRMLGCLFRFGITFLPCSLLFSISRSSFYILGSGFHQDRVDRVD
jgi:hypothetical protein